MDINTQITEKWNEDLSDQVSTLFEELSEKHGHKFDAVLARIEGFLGSTITAFWKMDEFEEGSFQ